MLSVKRRLIFVVVLAVLFLSWIGYLAVLAYTSRHTVVLSRQQLLAADLVVVAQVESLEKPVTVSEVVWPKTPETEVFVGANLPLANLKAGQADWAGPGLYLVPLVAKKTGAEAKFEVALPSPRMPGYDPDFDQGRKSTHPPRIYPATPETRAQVGKVLNP
jgi:hypothetical protein